MGKTWKDKIKDQFKSTIPDDYEVEFDICMKCGRRLPDKKYSTLKAHQEKTHSLGRKKKLKEMIFKYPLLMYPIIMILALVVLMGGMPPLIEYVVDPLVLLMFPDLEIEIINAEQCREDIGLFKEQLYLDGEFNSGHADEFNRLLNECNVNFFGVTQEPPIFEQEIYAPDQ